MTIEALSAGKYAAYIWPAYGVTLLGFAWMVGDTIARARRWKREAAQREGENEPSAAISSAEGSRVAPAFAPRSNAQV